MKKLIFPLMTLVIGSSLSASAFASSSGSVQNNISASAMATWEVSAVKDTKSALVVTPLKSLNFHYAEGSQAFNSVNGAFDVTIEGQSGATDFNLSSNVLRNILTRPSDSSTLAVGVAWNGKKISSQPVALIDTAQNINHDLTDLSTGYMKAGRASAQGNFTFSIDSATSDGMTATHFADLANGNWDGQVAVQFTATWNKP